MASEVVKWLVVGAGDIVRKRVAGALTGAKGSVLQGVCSLPEETAVSLAKDFSIKEVYSDLDKALKETEANAVYIATPVFLHAPQAMAALDAGKHVLVEKPLGLNYADCVPVIEKAKEKKLTAGCSYYRRFFPRFDMAKNMLESGEFGDVVLVRTTYYSWFSPAQDEPKHWRVEQERSGGGPLSDMGTHMFDLIIGLMGMPKAVYARTACLVNEWDVEDSSSIIMTLDNGAMVTAIFHWNSKTWTHEFEIVGTEARIKWHPADAPTVHKTVGRDILELDMPNAENVHLPVVQDFVDAINEGRAPRVTLEEAAKTNRLLDAIYESSRTGKEIEL